MHAQRPAPLSDIDERRDESRKLLGERRELVHYHHEPGERAWRVRFEVRGKVGCPGFTEARLSIAQLGLQ